MTPPEPRPECIGCPYNPRKYQRVVTAMSGALTVDLNLNEITGGGHTVHLSPLSARVAATLMQQPGEFIHPERLLLAMYGDREAPDTARNIISIQMRKVRDALKLCAPSALIVSSWGQGFRLVQQEGGDGQH